MIGSMDHFVITTADPDACLDFYQKLGFEAYDAGGRYELFAGDFKINVHVKGRELFPHAGKIQPGSADVCFRITGALEDFQKELIDKGLEIELGIVERTGAKGAMRSVYLRDTDENLLEFCSYEG